MQINCSEHEVLKPHCGNVPPDELTIHCPKLEVAFHTDRSGTDKGFKLRFMVNRPATGWRRITYSDYFESLA